MDFTLPTNDDRGPWYIKATTPLMALSSLAILLRFWSRALGPKSHRFWWDDWMALLAWAQGIAVAAVGILWTYHGLGRHMKDVSMADVTLGLKLLWVAMVIFLSAITFAKVSVLLFYARIFTTNSAWFKRALWITGFLCVSYLVVFVLVDVLGCLPLQKFWFRQKPGHCIDMYSMFLVCGLYDVVLDLIILILPLPMMWRLHIGRGRKISIFFAFICGYLALIPSLGRFATTVQVGKNMDDDLTYRETPEIFWCAAELPIVVISICIPSWFQLFKRAHKHGVMSIFSTRSPESKVLRGAGAGSNDSKSTGVVSHRDHGSSYRRNESSSSFGDEKYLGGQLATELRDDKTLIGRTGQHAQAWNDVTAEGEKMV